MRNSRTCEWLCLPAFQCAEEVLKHQRGGEGKKGNKCRYEERGKREEEERNR